MDSKTVRQLQKDYLWPSMPLYYEEPLVIESGKGCYVSDAEGKRYLDFFGGILTTSIQYQDEEINKAAIDQLHKVVHTSTLYPNEPSVRVAEKLAKITPGALKKSFLTPSGTDADETAVWLAQHYTGREEIIALRNCYSGRSYFARSMTAVGAWRKQPAKVPFFRHAHAPYCYRCDFGLKYPNCGMQCAKDIKGLIETTTVGQIAGFIAEPVQGVGGFVVAPKEYFEVAVPIVRKYGGVFICDEVQTGFGRTGGKWFGIEHWGVEPEIMTMAKGIANGWPLGAVIANAEIADSLPGPHISTFGGNPVACAAAIATLEAIEKRNLLERVTKAGQKLRAGLDELRQRFPKMIGEVRGLGLMQALELVVDETTGDRTPNVKATVALFEATKKRGLVIGKGGLYGNAIRISPPMMVSDAQIDDALKIFGEAFEEITKA